MKALTLHVLRDASGTDCTNNGVSSKHDRLALVGTIGPDGKFEGIRDTSLPNMWPADVAVALKRGPMGSVHIVPVENSEAGDWTMAGGNYAHTSDSRLGLFFEKIGMEKFYGALAIHDRVEKF